MTASPMDRQLYRRRITGLERNIKIRERCANVFVTMPRYDTDARLGALGEFLGKTHLTLSVMFKSWGFNTMQQRRPVRRALLSVSDKAGIVEFAQALSARGVELLSTGGTARLLADKGLPVTEVSDYTGFPEMMDGRVKTLHPKVHGGILGRRGQDDGIMQQHGIAPIDMVVVNLYPFAQTVAREGCSLEDAVENIDIGGPTMVRSAAKNHKDVAIVVKSNDYDAIINEMDANEGSLTLATRFDLAIKAFEHTAAYDSMIANYFGSMVPAYHGESKEAAGRFPRTLNLNFIKKQDMRYGENSHQQAASI